jgi:DNA-binding transcriptional regulator YiaG
MAENINAQHAANSQALKKGTATVRNAKTKAAKYWLSVMNPALIAFTVQMNMKTTRSCGETGFYMVQGEMTMTSKQFRKLRLEMGITQSELAEILSVNVRHIQRWESGETKVSRVVSYAMKYCALA